MDPLTATFASFGQGFGASLGRGILGDDGGGGPFVGGSSAASSFGTTLDGSGWIVNTGPGNQSGNTASPIRTTTNADTDPPLYGGATPTGGDLPALRAGGGTLGALLLLSVALGLLFMRPGRKG